MQEFIVALCLGAACAYLVRLAIQRMRNKSGGCCSCSKQSCCNRKQ